MLVARRLRVAPLSGHPKRVAVSAGVVLAAALTAVGGARAVHRGASGPAPAAAVAFHTVPAPTGIRYTTVSAGNYHDLALGSDGQVYAWGDNKLGEAGSGSPTTSVSGPQPVVDAPGVRFTAIAVGDDHSLALAADGTVWAWGDNDYGQLGVADMDTGSCQWADASPARCAGAPIAVQSPPGVSFTAIAAGRLFSLALGSDGQVYAWGDDNHGELGDGALVNERTPQPVHLPAGVRVVAVSANGNTAYALGSDGVAYAWGDDSSGQLGTTDTATIACYGGPCQTVPARVQTPAGVTFATIAAGSGYALALGSDGNTYAWGSNSEGELGINAPLGGRNVLLPSRVHTPAGVRFVALAAGSGYSLALGSDGNTYSWGLATGGALGNGRPRANTAPVRLMPPAGVRFTAVTTGSLANLAQGNNGITYAWGTNLDLG